MNEKRNLLAFGRVQPPATARMEISQMGTQDVRMPIQDFLEYEAELKWRCFRNTALVGVAGALLSAVGTLVYMKKKKPRWCR